MSPEKRREFPKRNGSLREIGIEHTGDLKWICNGLSIYGEEQKIRSWPAHDDLPVQSVQQAFRSWMKSESNIDWLWMIHDRECSIPGKDNHQVNISFLENGQCFELRLPPKFQANQRDRV